MARSTLLAEQTPPNLPLQPGLEPAELYRALTSSSDLQQRHGAARVPLDRSRPRRNNSPLQITAPGRTELGRSRSPLQGGQITAPGRPDHGSRAARSRLRGGLRLQADGAHQRTTQRRRHFSPAQSSFLTGAQTVQWAAHRQSNGRRTDSPMAGRDTTRRDLQGQVNGRREISRRSSQAVELLESSAVVQAALLTLIATQIELLFRTLFDLSVIRSPTKIPLPIICGTTDNCSDLWRCL